MRVADDHIAVPLRACTIHVGSVLDKDGRELFVADVNGELPDDVVRSRTAALVAAMNMGAAAARALLQ